jgi:hypothetical protein
MRLLLPLAAALVLAGCVAPAAEDVGRAGVPPVFEDPLVEQHDHSDPAAHAFSTPNMEQLGFTALGEEANETRGTYGEIDVQGDTAYVAVLGDGGETPGFLVVDLSERAAPRVVSFTPSPGTRIADVKGEPTNKWVFVGSERGGPTSQPRVTRAAGDLAAAAQAGDPERFATRNGIRVYDVGDPAAPVFTSFAPSDSGCHMLFYKQYAGGEWLFCVGMAVNVYSFKDGQADLVARYAPAPAEALGVVGENPADPLHQLTYEATPHDMTLQDDAASGKTLMYVSYWDLGLRIVDVSDPAKPVELGAWTGQGAQRYAGNVHTAMAYEAPGGKRYVYVIPELFTGDSVAALFVLDATDLAAPTLVGEWAPAGEHPNDGIRFSTHNFQVVGERLYLAFYHGGVWVLDLSGGRAASPQTLGYYLPHETVETWQPREETNAPDVWDVVLKDGYVYATDIAAGLYVLHYAGDALGDPALTSTA